MAKLKIIGESFYMLPPNRRGQPVKITKTQYDALGAKGSLVPISYAYSRSVFDSDSGVPIVGDTYTDENGKIVVWDDKDIKIEKGIKKNLYLKPKKKIK